MPCTATTSPAQAGVPESVVGRDTRAEERGGFYGIELIRNGRDGPRFRDHDFRISSVHGNSGYVRILTIHGVSASARFTQAVFTGEQAEANTLTDLPLRYPAAQSFDGQLLHVQERAAESDPDRPRLQWPRRCDRFRMILRGLEPDLVRAQRSAVRPREERPVWTLRLFCMFLHFCVPLTSCCSRRPIVRPTGGSASPETARCDSADA
jgi:hypothetical protein